MTRIAGLLPKGGAEEPNGSFNILVFSLDDISKQAVQGCRQLYPFPSYSVSGA